MPITSIKPKIMGLVLHGGRIQFFLYGTYSAAPADGQDGRQPNPCTALGRSSAASLLLTIGPSMRLISTVEPRRSERKIMPCASH